MAPVTFQTRRASLTTNDPTLITLHRQGRISLVLFAACAWGLGLCLFNPSVFGIIGILANIAGLAIQSRRLYAIWVESVGHILELSETLRKASHAQHRDQA